MSRLIKQIAVASLALTIAASNANANLLDSFFGGLFGPGGNRTAGPRQHVKIRGGFNPGDIIVSFGDRRLYYIESKATAISYAIAIPKEEARWSGVSYVSQKREIPFGRQQRICAVRIQRFLHMSPAAIRAIPSALAHSILATQCIASMERMLLG